MYRRQWIEEVSGFRPKFKRSFPQNISKLNGKLVLTLPRTQKKIFCFCCDNFHNENNLYVYCIEEYVYCIEEL